jgi:glutathione S-transferase
MAGLKVFVDKFSQPCRAVLMLLEANKIPYETSMVKIANGNDKKISCSVWACFITLHPGEHFTDEYKKINPMRMVPAISDNGFLLAERYL